MLNKIDYKIISNNMLLCDTKHIFWQILNVLHLQNMATIHSVKRTVNIQTLSQKKFLLSTLYF